MLDNIIKIMSNDRAFESHYPQLVSIVNKILPYFKDFSVLFAMVRVGVAVGGVRRIIP